MKVKGLLTASFLLLVLTGIIWWSNKKTATTDKTPAESATTKLLSITEDQIQDIEIKKRTSETIDLQRTGSRWQIAAPEPLRADPDAVSSMQIDSLAGALLDLNILDLIFCDAQQLSRGA